MAEYHRTKLSHEIFYSSADKIFLFVSIYARPQQSQLSAPYQKLKQSCGS